MNLDSFVQHEGCRLSGLVDRRSGELVDFAAPACALFEALTHGCGAQGQAARGLDLRIHVGQHRLNHLKTGDRFAELLACLGVVDGNIQCPLSNTQGVETDDGPFQIKPGHRHGNAAIKFADHVFCGHPAVLEHQFAGGRATETHLVELLRHLETGRVGFHDKGGNALGPFFGRCFGIDQHQIGNRPIGDIDLGAVQDVVVAILFGRGPHRAKRIGSRARFGQTQGADQRAVAKPRQVFAAQFVIGVAVDIVDAQIVMGHMGQSDGRRGARHFLGDDTGRSKIQPRAAKFRRHVQAEISHLAQLGENRRRQVICIVHFRIQMVEFGHEELAGLIGQGLLFVRHEMCWQSGVVAQLLVHGLVPLRRAKVLRQ